MKVNGIDGGAMYSGGVFKVTLHDSTVYEDRADCDKVNDVLLKYGKDKVRRIEYKFGDSVDIIYNRKQSFDFD